MTRNLGELVRYWGDWRPQGVAIRYAGRDITWTELDTGSDELAAGLLELGVSAGDRVGILLYNCPEYIEVAVAALKVGAMVVPLNTRYTAKELVHPIADAACRVVVTEAALANLLADVSGPTQFCIDEHPELPRLDQLRSVAPLPTSDVPGESPAFLCYTSGTTGFPKGAVLSHDNVIAGGIAKLLADGIRSEDRLLLPYPLAFTGGIVSCVSEIALVSGCTVVLEHDFNPERCLRLIEEERISVFTGVPVIFEQIAQHPNFASTDVSSLRSLTTGGSTVKRELLDAYAARGLRLTQSYGQTEASGGITYLSAEDAPSKPGSAGIAITFVKVRVVDENDEDVAPGTVGEILVKGPTVMSGYWNQPDATSAALRGGWLHTGDLGSLDDAGYLWVADRKKDMFISGGINVYPAEIERVLSAVGLISDFTVIGVRDDRWGEVPMIVSADAPGTVDVTKLNALLVEELADFKRPRYLLEIGEPIPRSSLSGKLQKHLLRSRFPSAPPDAVDLKAARSAAVGA